MAILDFYCQSSFWQISNFRFLLLLHIGRINWQISHHRCIQQQRMVILDFYCQFILADQLIYLPPKQRHLVAKNGNFRFLLLDFILADQLEDLPPIDTSSSKEWQCQISTVRDQICRSAILDFYIQSSYWQINWHIYPLGEASSGQEWEFQISTMRVHIGRSTGRSTSPQTHLVAKNGDFRFLLLVHIGRSAILYFYCQSSYWQINWHIYPLGEASSDHEWQFQISTVRVHIGRSTGISTHLGEASSDHEWQFQISTVRVHIGRSTGISTPWERHLVTKNGNFRFLL